MSGTGGFGGRVGRGIGAGLRAVGLPARDCRSTLSSRRLSRSAARTSWPRQTKIELSFPDCHQTTIVPRSTSSLTMLLTNSLRTRSILTKVSSQLPCQLAGRPPAGDGRVWGNARGPRGRTCTRVNTTDQADKPVHAG